MAKNLTTLKSILNNSKIQVTNNALYQTIVGLIEQVEKSVTQINSDIATLKGGGAALPPPGITQLTGDVTAGPGSGSQIATLSNTGVTAGTYGDAIDVSQITVDAKGRISAASNVPISVTGAGGLVRSGYYLYDGTNYFFPVFQATLPINSNYTWINQVDSTITVVGNAILLDAPNPGTGSVYDWRLRKKAQPSTPYKITIAYIPRVTQNHSSEMVGLGFRESSSGKLILIYEGNTGGVVAFGVDRMTNPTTFNAEPAAVDGPIASGVVAWLQIENDGTNLHWRYSWDGYNFIQLYTVAIASFGFW